ncbi:tRNA pseudouridine(55) synthase TruB [Patescibacteria group bacterium]|nr:tRNA pseudouridine(55) synthase TruB [Patescibacteria group bacterium]
MKKIVAINKSKGPTSHDIINQLRRITGTKKIGHAGTLDPLASGVLVVAISREATKQIDQIVNTEKEYLATIKLGEQSSTDDEEGEKEIFEVTTKPDNKQVEQALSQFIGQIEQIPPQFSAIKVQGRAAYKSARLGQTIKLKPRPVEIKNIEILEYVWPILKIKVTTGKGVYIRSLARDLGRSLGCGGYLADLVRTRVGEFTLENSHTVEQFGKAWKTSYNDQA